MSCSRTQRSEVRLEPAALQSRVTALPYISLKTYFTLAKSVDPGISSGFLLFAKEAVKGFWSKSVKGLC